MSKIDTQIKELQFKKKKIDYINYVSDLVKNDTKCIDFKEVKTEIISKIEPFLQSLVSSIETDSEISPETKSQFKFSEEESTTLKMLASKILTKTETGVRSEPVSSSQSPAPSLAKQKTELDITAKTNFALDNRHLANKEVQVINDANVQIRGIVVGLDAPHVLVKTTSGPTIMVPLEKIIL